MKFGISISSLLYHSQPIVHTRPLSAPYALVFCNHTSRWSNIRASALRPAGHVVQPSHVIESLSGSECRNYERKQLRHYKNVGLDVSSMFECIRVARILNQPVYIPSISSSCKPASSRDFSFSVEKPRSVSWREMLHVSEYSFPELKVSLLCRHVAAGPFTSRATSSVFYFGYSY